MLPIFHSNTNYWSKQKCGSDYCTGEHTNDPSSMGWTHSPV